MHVPRKIMIAAAVGLAAAGASAGVAVATFEDGDDTHDEDTPIVDADLERASAAALAHTGGGRVTDTEVGDEESYYEVEVTLDDGSQVDVQLDESFAVVDTLADDE